MAEEDFLSRWSRRKTLAKSADREAAPPAPGAAPPAPAAAAAQGAPAEPAPLPPVESLTPESDFAPFMAPEVDGDVRRKALRTLFTDPHFNTMDMLDVYVDDYSKPDPLPASWLDKLEQLSRLGDRAGRDREEAERRRALAEAGQAPTPGQEAGQAPETASGAEPETASAAEPEAASAAEPEAPPPPAADPHPGDAGIPPLPIGKSGT